MITMKVYLVIVLILSLVSIGCPLYPTYGHIRIQPTVVNLEMLNTEYDEYNAAAPPGYYSSQNLLYASNAPSEGEYFDILHSRITLDMSWIYGTEEEITDEHTFDLTATEGVLFLDRINSNYDEYGPSLFSLTGRGIYIYSRDHLEENVLYMLASNRPDHGGDSFNIYYYTELDGRGTFAGNSDSHDFYPTYHDKSSTLFFCSNRDGDYAIYRYHDESIDHLPDLLSHPAEPEPLWELGPWDDKYPYVYRDIMVFSSNRDGDYNLYFSRYNEGDWSEPRLLPSQIKTGNNDSFHYLNSNYNEHRPVLFEGIAYDTDWNMLMIFSSDRPGGKGGLDLYLAVLPLDIFD